MNKPKWLICIDWFLPGYHAGGPVSSIKNLVDHLGEYFDFHILTSNKDYQSQEAYEIEIGEWIDQGNYSVMYVDASKFSKSQCTAIIKSLAPKGVYVNSVYSKQFTRWPVSISNGIGIKVIIATRGMLAPSALAIKPLKKRLYLKYVKSNGVFAKATFQATNEIERSQILNVFPKANVKVVSNLPTKIRELDLKKHKKGTVLKLISLGRIAPEKNTLFAIQCLKKLAEVEVELDLYGAQYDPKYWQDCQTEIHSLGSNINVSYKGTVSPVQVMDTISNYDFLFLPSRGENFGHVIIESLTAGIPVIISNRTPWKDIEEKNCGYIASVEGLQDMLSKLKTASTISSEDYETMQSNALDYAASYLAKSKTLESAIELFT